MKSNRDFLDGIYSKAEELEKEMNKGSKSPRINYRFASIAAMIILIPTILFWNSNRGYQELASPMVVRTMNDPSSYFYEADIIVIGETEEVGKSQYIKEDNYIYTDITIKLDEILKGQIDEEEIVLRVNGGKVKKEKVWSQMDSEFIKGKHSMLFLIRDESGIYYLINSQSQFDQVGEDLFKDNLGNEYKLEKIKNIILEEEN